MPFPLNLYLLAGLGAVVASAASLPLWRALCRRIGLVDDPGHRKLHQAPIPLAGGLAVLTGLLAPLLVGLGLLQFPRLLELLSLPTSTIPAADLLQYGFEHRGRQLFTILLSALGMAAVGLLDDQYELRPARKFAGQCFFALVTALAGIRITLFIDNVWFSYGITVLWILTLTNAFNFMDNMNGLCAGISLVAAWCISLAAMTQGHYLVASIAFVIAGAILGFLPYNVPRATAFLGDTGSHLLGYLLAVLAILPHFYSRENPRSWAVLSPLLILAVPLVDLVWVVLLRWYLGKPFYIGDTNHLSHRLVRCGLNPTLAVLLLCLGGAIMGGLALLLF